MNAILLVAVSMVSVSPWEQSIVDHINAVRVDADLRELAIYGFLEDGPRLPLAVDARLTDSSAWWCAAIRGTRLSYDVYGWWVNADGFLVSGYGSETVISDVWLPQIINIGFSAWLDRLIFLGVPAISSEEISYFPKNTQPDFIVGFWTRSGYHDDPRQATIYYRVLIDPRWTHMGVAKAPWGSGFHSVVADFAEEAENQPAE